MTTGMEDRRHKANSAVSVGAESEDGSRRMEGSGIDGDLWLAIFHLLAAPPKYSKVNTRAPYTYAHAGRCAPVLTCSAAVEFSLI